MLAVNPHLKVPDIRGNVATRLQKVSSRPELDATLLALAGISRLNFQVEPDGRLLGPNVPENLLAKVLDVEEMLPCVGQGAIGIEIRENDARLAALCERLNDLDTYQCVSAERAFLSAMGGGCQSPVAAYAEVRGGQLHMRALSFTAGPVRRAQDVAGFQQAVELGRRLAERLK